MSSPRPVQTTTINEPKILAPIVTKRCSPAADGSSIVRASGSLSTPSPSESETPCFRRLIAFFFGSNSMANGLLYAYCTYLATHLRGPQVGTTPTRERVCMPPNVAHQWPAQAGEARWSGSAGWAGSASVRDGSRRFSL